MLEQQLMTDQDLFSHLLKAEEELIDEYARGQIPSEEAQALECRFLDNARHWDDLQFAEVLQLYLAKHHAKLSPKVLSSDGGT